MNTEPGHCFQDNSPVPRLVQGCKLARIVEDVLNSIVAL